MRSSATLSFVLLLTFCGWLQALPTGAQVVLHGDDASQVLVVRNVEERPDGTITGVLVNKSEQPISEVRLLIRHTFLWSRERQPKAPEDNPGRAVYYDLDTTIAASAAVGFLYRANPPLTKHKDGRFQTVVQVVSFNVTTLPSESEAGGE